MGKKEIKNSNIIEAKWIGETENAWYLDCEGDKHWFPKTQCNFNKQDEELEAPIWLLKSKFPGENF